jgi:hypothetical protein
MYKVGRNILLVPFGNFLNDDLCLVNTPRGEQPSWRLGYYPPEIVSTNQKQGTVERYFSFAGMSFLFHLEIFCTTTCFVNTARREQPSWRLGYYPPSNCVNQSQQRMKRICFSLAGISFLFNF